MKDKTGYFSHKGDEYRWVRRDLGCRLQRKNERYSYWANVDYFPPEALLDAVAALTALAKEETEQDWVMLTPYLRCLRDGTSPQFKPSLIETWHAWEDTTEADNRRPVFEAYRMGLAAGEEDK